MTANNHNLVPRPPVVVVMGHVDHGKTTLLDFIRKASVAAKEAGGITQHIGAYEISHNGKRITFIDTPGHEAFSKIRSRGAKVADVAILVVAAEEGVKPQTKEAISILEEAKIPFLVAINKIDKPEANPEKVKQELATAGVAVEGWGGKVPVAAVSATTGQGVPEVLDLVLLLAELEELKADEAKAGSGFVIEAHLDARRGPSATVVILEGTVRRGDFIFAGAATGKVKILENFLGENVNELSFSSPAKIIGWEGLPLVGEEFRTGEKKILELVPETVKAPQPLAAAAVKETGEAIVPKIALVLKADVAGSLEALEESVKKLAKTIGIEVKIVGSSVGDIGEADVKLAQAAEAVILSFRARKSREAEAVLKTTSIEVLESDIIYKLLETLEEKFARLAKSFAESKISGELEVLATFQSSGSKQVIGGKVLSGKLIKGALASVLRRGSKIAEGRIANLQTNREDVNEVVEGNECGILFDAPIQVIKGDVLQTKEQG